MPAVPSASSAALVGTSVSSAPSVSSALAADYRRMLEFCPVLELRLLDAAEPDPCAADDWYSGAELAADERALVAVLAGAAARIAAEHGRAPRPHVTASRLLHHYVWSACLLIAGPWHLARRVPVLGSADLWLHAPTGAFALRPRGSVTLPGDDELRAELRAAVVEHLGPVLAAFAGPTRRRDRALWGMVTDDLASALWYLGRMLGEEEASVAAAEAVLPGGTLPLPGAAGFRRLHTPDGRAHRTRTRLGCCLHYAVGPAAVACLTCPRTSDEERLRRL
ncbi:(2Fe-2S)-binding protein [Streptomyces sp. CBMA156]|uniref:(2Fe-2S)-binding protein n=1 Tax=Streptomyces sp. CBMA156 TaxID=1930280 RepID=UPI001661F2BE|nr:(2Fe-2S)-binding protein [Streptomyces sp. CBMA156]